jgi:transcriptional regulator with XRE-family HTH domain
MSYGEKLRKIRKRLGMTLEDVSQKTGFTKSFISQIENGKNSPSISSLKKICYALGVSISELFEDEKNIVLKLTKEDYKILKNKSTSIMFLAAKCPNRKIEPTVFEIEPHSETGTDFYSHSGEEFGCVIEGSLIVVIGNDEYPLSKGESIYFSSNLPHKVKNKSDKKAKAFWVGTPPTF